MTSTHSSSRRPRRPGDVRHDPAVPDALELLDERRLTGGAQAGKSAPALPVVCSEVMLLRARTDCPECGGRTPVYALLGTPEFETADRSTSVLRLVSELPAELDKAVREFSQGRWRRDLGDQASGAHLHSHCQHCHARLSEAFVLGTQGPFQPALYKQRMAIKDLRIPGPFVMAGAERHHSQAMLDWLDWVHKRQAKAARAA